MGKQDLLKKNLASFGQKPIKRVEEERQQQEQSVVDTASVSAQPAKRPVGRPKIHNDGVERTSITLDPIIMGKLRMMCVEYRRQIRDVIEDALQEYFDRFEQEHGKIRVPSTYRK